MDRPFDKAMFLVSSMPEVKNVARVAEGVEENAEGALTALDIEIVCALDVFDVGYVFHFLVQ
jgi:hypothetical protein